MVSLLGDVEDRGGVSLRSPDFEPGDRMPDFVGAANSNENPELRIENVPEEAASLVLMFDDPDTEPSVGFTFTHWLVWNVDSDIGTIPRGWEPASAGATVGYNDLIEQSYAGPAPRSGEHTYRFKVLALADELTVPPEARKTILDFRIGTDSEVLGSSQLVGRFHPSQGTPE